MKKILGIVVLSLLLSINAYSEDSLFKRGVIKGYKEKNIFEKAFDAVNPLNYFEKKKRCQAIADNMDTVRIGKIRYKECMDK
jgi:hypothetical protein